MRIEFTPEGKESLHELHIENQEKIRREIKKLFDNPKLGKALVDNLYGYYSLVVGNYRAIYTIEGDRIIILLVGHRRDVYNRITRN